MKLNLNEHFLSSFYYLVDAIDEYRKDTCYQFSKIYGIDLYLKDAKKDIPLLNDYINNKGYYKHFREFNNCFKVSGCSEDIVSLYKRSRIISSSLIGAFIKKSRIVEDFVREMNVTKGLISAIENDSKKFQGEKIIDEDINYIQHYEDEFYSHKLIHIIHWMCYFVYSMHELNFVINRDGIKETIDNEAVLEITSYFNFLEDGMFTQKERIDQALDYLSQAIEFNNFDNGMLKHDVNTLKENLDFLLPFAEESEKREDEKENTEDENIETKEEKNN